MSRTLGEDRGIEENARGAIEPALEPALQETPTPSLRQLAKRLGFSAACVLKAHAPALYDKLKARWQAYAETCRAELRSKLLAVLEENPPPSLKSVYSRFSVTESIVNTSFPELRREIGLRHLQYQRQQAQGRRDEVRAEIREIVRILHAQGICPSVPRVTSRLKSGSLREWRVVGKAVSKTGRRCPKDEDSTRASVELAPSALLFWLVMLVERQIAERRERAAATIAKVLERPSGEPYGDYRVKSASGKTYRVAMRGPGLFENYCSCPDFAVNTLGTCKHIEALLLRLGKRYGRSLENRKFARSRASISLQYGETIAVRLRLPADPSPALRKLAEEYFDPAGLLRPEHFRSFHQVIEVFRQTDLDAVIYSDVLEYLDRENELAEGLELERQLLAKLRRGRHPLDGILKTKLLPYQERGAIFAACRGRVVLADDMGLGKTVQALAATEMLRRRRGIQRVLVVAPASVKYQWKTEIEKFSGLSAQVIEGLLPRRRALYASPQFFNLSSYELVLKDVRYMHELAPDLIILDEAQRIRNWTTATARTIKQLKSRYAFVLTGTPLENKLEELFSVVEFIDGRRLGPAFRFLHEHRTEDEHGTLIGYRGLDQIHDQLAPILLRRTRQEVLKDLPKRTDQILHVALTSQQAEPYWEQNDILAALMRKWERQGWLSEIDQKRVLCCLQNMRMLCNSTFLFDKQTNHSPKLAEFREIVRELTIEEGRKVVVFSEYERMTHLAGKELEKLGIGFVSLHGSVPSRNRGALMEKFRRDAECRVFLSTDAGGVGLNLQTASAVVNFEPPWNPARLEQRIGRVHRLGQAHPVHVVHLVTKDSIEERVWETLKLKKSLFAGIFDSPTGEVSFAALGRKSVLQAVKEIFANQPGRPKPLIDQPVTKAVPIRSTAGAIPTAVSLAAAPPSTGFEQAAAGLIETGVRFLESLVAVGKGAPPGAPLGETLSNLMSVDPRTDRPVLSIPLPKSVDQKRLIGALSAVLGAFGRST